MPLLPKRIGASVNPTAGAASSVVVRIEQRRRWIGVSGQVDPAPTCPATSKSSVSVTGIENVTDARGGNGRWSWQLKPLVVLEITPAVAHHAGQSRPVNAGEAPCVSVNKRVMLEPAARSWPFPRHRPSSGWSR
jgi:hypothetical protein